MRPSELTSFCLRSAVREYGLGFILRVVARHPVLTLGRLGRRFLESGGQGWTFREDRDPGAFVSEKAGPEMLVGLGFCLKPVHPPCPSGRASHDCSYFEHSGTRRHPVEDYPPCRDCLIRKIGEPALGRGCGLYIMTSARDILSDVLIPVLEHRLYTSALLALCRYSFDPFGIALTAVGLEARLIAFTSGDCRNYRDWRRADLGMKEDRTRLDPVTLSSLLSVWSALPENARSGAFARRGNIYMLSIEGRSGLSGTGKEGLKPSA
jgi:hypothetical protein